MPPSRATFLPAVLFACALLPDLASAAQGPEPLQVSGEVGFRVEYIANEAFAQTAEVAADDHRLRARVRARVGVGQRLGSGWTAELRLSTGAPDFPATGWTTLSTDFRKQAVQLDRALLRFERGWVTLRGGIGPTPVPSPTELVWDPDVQPAGLSQSLRLGESGLVLAAGQLSLRELRTSRAGLERGAFLFVHGLTHTGQAGPVRLGWGVSHHLYTRPDALALAIQQGELDREFRTNRLDPLGPTVADPRGGAPLLASYFSGFNVLGAHLQAELEQLPLSLTVEGALNLAARRAPELGAGFSTRQGRAVGGWLRYGRAEAPWAVRGAVGLFLIEADAVLAVYNGDDLQQTNVRSVPLELTVRLPGTARLVLDAYLQHKLDPALAGPGGATHPQNALKVRARTSLLASF
jgi:hypothetical protein